MNIDFIKWMIGYAKGFEWEIPKHIATTEYGIIFEGKYFHKDSALMKPLVIPHLLTRAIEGINENIKHEWMITADGNNIEVHDIKGLVDGWAYTDIDEAKIQALKYIYEQEKK